MNSGQPFDPRSTGETFDAGSYGRSFADVYDRWYPTDADTVASVDRLCALAPEAGTVLELGIGTGRLAIPLAHRGLDVTGIDASPEMLDALRSNVAAVRATGAGGHDAGGAGTGDRRAAGLRALDIEAVLGDVATPEDWPTGRFDLVVATNNLLMNVADPSAQQRCLTRAAAALGADGRLVVELIVARPFDADDPPGGRRDVEVKEVGPDGVVLIVTDTDPVTRVVTAAHVELRHGEPVRLRPWRIRLVTLEELDRWAGDAGLVLERRWSDWAGRPFDGNGASAISIYRPRPG
jgi:SAM-dependent methyltransferase